MPISWAIARVSLSSSADRSHVATWHPASTSCSTSWRPIPLAPPVTTAIFPSKSCMARIMAQHPPPSPCRTGPPRQSTFVTKFCDPFHENLVANVDGTTREAAGRVRQSGDDPRHPRRLRCRAAPQAVVSGRDRGDRAWSSKTGRATTAATSCAGTSKRSRCASAAATCATSVGSPADS